MLLALVALQLLVDGGGLKVSHIQVCSRELFQPALLWYALTDEPSTTGKDYK